MEFPNGITMGIAVGIAMGIVVGILVGIPVEIRMGIPMIMLWVVSGRMVRTRRSTGKLQHKRGYLNMRSPPKAF